ncbi:MAG TPA: nucleoside triphosphate pyrophosphohydrolase [Kiloniellales bacterium]|nr:nucleoside triphosphate pyrophosphohydrolase [Kiloniellales bacterium]
MPDDMESLPPLERLRAIMARLRDPERGCPWDLAQDFRSIAPYTVEEAYEVAEAIRQGDMTQLKDELGDLLLQVVFHARMAEEAGAFALDDVANAISDKMLRRHPHVFGQVDAETPEAVTANWETIKAEERAAKRGGRASSRLEGITQGLPTLTRAVKLQRRASEVGFDWNDTRHVLDKLSEEIGEVEAELAAGADKARLTDELGDVLFVIANLARHLDIDPETALGDCNAKFERRFRQVEAALAAQGRTLEQASLDEMEAEWTRIKREEKAARQAVEETK